jgi:hypothetical protein
MNQPNNQDLLRQIAILNSEIIHFDFTKSFEEQKMEVARIAKSVEIIANQFPLSATEELAEDLVKVGECASNPLNIVGCFKAILAIIDLLKVVAGKDNP